MRWPATTRPQHAGNASEKETRMTIVEPTETTQPRCTVSFTRATTKDRIPGYHVHAETGVSQDEAEEVMRVATWLRDQAEATIEEEVPLA